MFLVVFDNEDGYCSPMTWDADCRGAIECNNGAVALFPNRKAAQKAIRISTLNAKLRREQGKPSNTDFTEALQHIKIRPATEATR